VNIGVWCGWFVQLSLKKVVQDGPEKIFDSDPIFAMSCDKDHSFNSLKKKNTFTCDVTPCGPFTSQRNLLPPFYLEDGISTLLRKVGW
jgi:hypothetical protein